MSEDGVQVSVGYSEGSAASGALFSFVFLTEDGGVDFNRSALLALERPYRLHAAHSVSGNKLFFSANSGT